MTLPEERRKKDQNGFEMPPNPITFVPLIVLITILAWMAIR